MSTSVCSSVLVGALLLWPAVSAVEVRFFYSPLKDSCAWGGTNTFPATNNTANGGVCAYVPSRNRLFACPAPDPNCWGFNILCTGGSTTTAGPNQILCGRSFGTQWCCGEGEACTSAPGQINVCIPTEFSNPNEGVSPADARAKQFSALPSESIVTSLPRSTPSAFSTLSPSTSSTSSNARSVTSSGSSNAAGASSDASSTNGSSNVAGSSGISGGAIAGIVVGAIAGTLAVVGLVLFLLRRNKKNKAIGPDGGRYEKPHEDWNTQYAPSTIGDTTVSGQYPHTGYYAGEVYAKEGSEYHSPQQADAHVHLAGPPQELPVNTKPTELP